MNRYSLLIYNHNFTNAVGGKRNWHDGFFARKIASSESVNCHDARSGLGNLVAVQRGLLPDAGRGCSRYY